MNPQILSEHIRTGMESPLLSADYVYIRTFEELDRGRIELSEKETEAEFFNSEMKTKWEGLRKEQLHFLADVRKYDQFFCENERKFKRVSAKITTELAVQRHLKWDIDTCRERNEYLSNILLKMEDSVNVLTPYNTFVSTLVANERTPEDGLKDINSLINLIVSISQNRLHDEFSNALLEYESLLSQMQNYKLIKQSEFSKQTYNLFRSKKILNREKVNLILFQNKLERNKVLKESEKSQLVIHDNIYRLLREWKKIFHLQGSENPDQEIFSIGNIVDELRCVVKRAQEIFSKKNLSDEVDSSFMTLQRL